MCRYHCAGLIHARILCAEIKVQGSFTRDNYSEDNLAGTNRTFVTQLSIFSIYYHGIKIWKKYALTMTMIKLYLTNTMGPK
jgi:hypothetical protein